MAMAGSSFNPYQPPTETSNHAGLVPDTEFLLNDKVVAGVGRIVLPRICVVTGATVSLGAYENRLWSRNRWIATARSIMILAAVLGGIPMLTHLPSGMNLLSPSPGVKNLCN